jgi:phospholipid-binding lipoprotein MlaA
MSFRLVRSALTLAAVSAMALLGACANQPKPAPTSAATPVDDVNNDPYETVNREIWEIDLTFDRFFLKPIAIGYRDATPTFFQRSVSNILTNLRTPVIFVNDVLQGDPDKAAKSLARLYINSVMGVGGIFDVASAGKVPFHDSDFGQTLGVWGVGSGPFLVLPLLGPSDPRDAIGYGVDSFIDPFDIEMRAHGFDEANYVRLGVGIVSDRAMTLDELDELQKSSLDFYAAVRSLYQQRRAAAIDSSRDGGTATPVVPYDDLSAPTPSKTAVPPSPAGKAQ